ncbi:hypothetical protein QBC33DRAFT_513967 [Phialemonium atrogriseum]|uniref:Uncharacterized protein n=1 Tax=Phialemonium atrogriseum TaxID=1093897 RepID=A0AAJ0C460_9PEZI|nr:uncharacterized protein QBC33DRAFT_513967 [Phialemonium atrogriseum]KAK1768352.1 hypothetical protein QBC33DRAFT_513967 [Phialemonium atrogriseum]
MKWQTVSLIAFSGSASLASPIKSTARSGELDIYTLRISTKSNKSLDGKYLGESNSTIGVFHGSSAVRIYAVPGRSEAGSNQLVELHTYPIGIVDHALALSGAGEQLDLVNLVNPAATTSAGGDDTYDWTSFSLDSQPRDAGKPANCVDYSADRAGRWVAIPAGNEDEWSVKWQGADGIFTAVNMPIDIVYEKVEV